MEAQSFCRFHTRKLGEISVFYTEVKKNKTNKLKHTSITINPTRIVNTDI